MFALRQHAPTAFVRQVGYCLLRVVLGAGAALTLLLAAVTPAASGTALVVAHLLMRPQAVIYSLAFSPDSRLLSSGHEGGSVRLWDVPAG